MKDDISKRAIALILVIQNVLLPKITSKLKRSITYVHPCY